MDMSVCSSPAVFWSARDHSSSVPSSAHSVSLSISHSFIQSKDDEVLDLGSSAQQPQLAIQLQQRTIQLVPAS